MPFAQAILQVALRQQKGPEYLLQMLGRLVLPATGDHRVEGPFLEEGLVMAVMAEAARCGHVELALRAWDFLEYALLPLDLPKPPAHGNLPLPQACISSLHMHSADQDVLCVANPDLLSTVC